VPAILEALTDSPRVGAENYLMSFDWDSCAEVVRLRPHLPVFGLVPGPAETPIPLDDVAARAREIGLHGLGISDEWLETLELDGALRARAFSMEADHPLRLSVWTVDDPARAMAWIRLGACMLTANDPGGLRAALGPAIPLGTRPPSLG
jgi:glycerophosphoryl diester phosphodiesterase